MKKEKGVLREKKGALASENDNYFVTTFEYCYSKYFGTGEQTILADY